MSKKQKKSGSPKKRQVASMASQAATSRRVAIEASEAAVRFEERNRALSALVASLVSRMSVMTSIEKIRIPLAEVQTLGTLRIEIEQAGTPEECMVLSVVPPQVSTRVDTVEADGQTHACG